MVYTYQPRGLVDYLGSGLSQGFDQGAERKQTKMTETLARKEKADAIRQGVKDIESNKEYQDAPLERKRRMLFDVFAEYPELVKEFLPPEKGASSGKVNTIEGVDYSDVPEPYKSRIKNAPTVGAATAAYNQWIDESSRREGGGEFYKPGENEEGEVVDYDKGLNPKERASVRESRYKTQTPLYNDLNDYTNTLGEYGLLIDRLEQINDSDKLPSGSGRFNVNPKTGELLLPNQASPEAQLYVKTVNEFLRGARDTFGSRVTNFEVERFLARLPNLTNSPEGRRMIIAQMKLFNERAELQNKGLQKEINKYGVRGIDWDRAIANTEKKIAPELQALNKRIKSLDGQLDHLNQQAIDADKAKAKSRPGFKLMMDPTGKKTWVPDKSVPGRLKAEWTQV